MKTTMLNGSLSSYDRQSPMGLIYFLSC